MTNVTRNLLRFIEIIIVLVLIVLSLHIINTTLRKIFILENKVEYQQYLLDNLNTRIEGDE